MRVRLALALALTLGLAAPVAETAVLLVARDKPQTDRDLRRVEQLAGECHHAIDEVGLDDRLANLALAGLVRRHAAIGEDETGHAGGREVMHEVLHPGEVGVAQRR